MARNTEEWGMGVKRKEKNKVVENKKKVAFGKRFHSNAPMLRHMEQGLKWNGR